MRPGRCAPPFRRKPVAVSCNRPAPSSIGDKVLSRRTRASGSLRDAGFTTAPRWKAASLRGPGGARKPRSLMGSSMSRAVEFGSHHGGGAAEHRYTNVKFLTELRATCCRAACGTAGARLIHSYGLKALGTGGSSNRRGPSPLPVAGVRVVFRKDSDDEVMLLVASYKFGRRDSWHLLSIRSSGFNRPLTRWLPRPLPEDGLAPSSTSTTRITSREGGSGSTSEGGRPRTPARLFARPSHPAIALCLAATGRTPPGPCGLRNR